MVEQKSDDPAIVPSAAEEPCEVVVKRRAKAGLATICVALTVALLTLAGAAATLLATGMIPLSGFEGRISSAMEERLGRDWKVEAAAAELERIDGRSRLRVRQVVFHHSSGAVIRAPEAIMGYEPLALLRGDIRLVSIDLRGVNVRLGVSEDGALIVNADSAPAEPMPAPTIPDAAQWNVFTGVMGAVSILADGGGILGALETAGMNGARLQLVDPQGRLKAGFEDVDIRLTRVGQGGTRLAVKGRTGQRWKEFAVDLSTDADGTRRAEIDVQRFEPAEVFALALGTAGVALEGLPLKGRATLTQASDGKRSLKASLDVLPGTVRFPNGPMSTLAVDGAHFEVESGRDLGDLILSKAQFRSGATNLEGSGSLREEEGAWRMTFDGGGRLVGLDGDPAVVLDSVTADVRYDPRSNEVRIDRMALKGPAIAAEGTGYVQRVGESPLQRFSIRATDSDARAILAVWPRWTSREAHTVLSDQLLAGRMSSVQVDLDLSAEDHARLVRGAGLPDKALTVVVAGENVTYAPGPGLPPLVKASVSGKITGRSIQLAIPAAAAELGQGRELQLSEGTFDVAETWMDRAPARIGFRSSGPMEALAALFSFPALKEFSPGQIDPSSLRGSSDLKATVLTPLADNLKRGELVVTATGTLTGVASDSLLAPEKLEAGSFAVNFDRNGLVMRGDARVSGDKAQIELRQNPKGQGEATLQFVLDNAARQRRGLGPEAGITGPTPVKVVKALGKAGDPPPRVEIDLTKAALDGTLPGLNKPAGRSGRVSFSYVADKDGPDLDDFQLDAPPILVRGKLELNAQNGFDAASLSQVKLSPGDNFKVDARRDGNATKLVIRGAVMDARPFIKDLMESSAPASSGRGDKTAARSELELDLDVPILTGFNNEAVTNATLKLSKRGSDLRSVAFQGRIGRADVTARQPKAGDGGGPLVVQSQNGGALMRFFDIYRRAYGGDLILTMTPGENSQRGDLLFRDFMVRDEPALKRVVGDQPGAAPSGDRAGANPAPAVPRIDVSDVRFTKLKAEFTRSASRLEVSEAVIWGQQVGFTLQGQVDYGRDRVDLGGTFVPGYAFNNAFAQVPVVGALLGGGSQYGGLFAVNFKISGAASAPTMTVNPLSAIAPGILRRFVDPLGGAPDQRPATTMR